MQRKHHYVVPRPNFVRQSFCMWSPRRTFGRPYWWVDLIAKTHVLCQYQFPFFTHPKPSLFFIKIDVCFWYVACERYIFVPHEVNTYTPIYGLKFLVFGIFVRCNSQTSEMSFLGDTWCVGLQSCPQVLSFCNQGRLTLVHCCAVHHCTTRSSGKHICKVPHPITCKGVKMGP